MSWVVVFCGFLGLFCLIVGTMIGMTVEARAATKDERDRQADAEADRFLGELREVDPAEHAFTRPGRTSSRSQNTRAKRTSTAAFLAAGQPDKNGSEGAGLVGLRPSRSLPSPRQAHEAWLAHEEQALDVASDDPTGHPDVLAEIHAELDRFIAEVVHGGQQ